jgi:hypothetical protein
VAHVFRKHPRTTKKCHVRVFRKPSALQRHYIENPKQIFPEMKLRGLVPSYVEVAGWKQGSQRNFVTNEFREIETKQILLLRKRKWSFRVIPCYGDGLLRVTK